MFNPETQHSLFTQANGRSSQLRFTDNCPRSDEPLNKLLAECLSQPLRIERHPTVMVAVLFSKLAFSSTTKTGEDLAGMALGAQI
ncbi:hypothetical protein TrVGV298_011718 [Trichoderma virens]|nr:hypothetical protein TrVGV298_011718 [Trichoderma virens]